MVHLEPPSQTPPTPPVLRNRYPTETDTSTNLSKNYFILIIFNLIFLIFFSLVFGLFLLSYFKYFSRIIFILNAFATIVTQSKFLGLAKVLKSGLGGGGGRKVEKMRDFCSGSYGLKWQDKPICGTLRTPLPDPPHPPRFAEPLSHGNGY